MFLEHGLEALVCSVDGPPERRRGDQLDPIMEGEVVAKDATLFVSEVGQGGIVDDVVRCAQVVDALMVWLVSSTQ